VSVYFHLPQVKQGQQIIIQLIQSVELDLSIEIGGKPLCYVSQQMISLYFGSGDFMYVRSKVKCLCRVNYYVSKRSIWRALTEC